MNHLPTFVTLTLSNLQRVSGGFSLATITAKYGCILYAPGHPNNPIVPSPVTAMTE